MRRRNAIVRVLTEKMHPRRFILRAARVSYLLAIPLPQGNKNKIQNIQDPRDEVCILKYCNFNIKTLFAARGQTGKMILLDIPEAALPPPRLFHP